MTTDERPLLDAWQQLAIRNNKARATYTRLAGEYWERLDVTIAVRYRGIVEGLEMAAHNQAEVIAEAPCAIDEAASVQPAESPPQPLPAGSAYQLRELMRDGAVRVVEQIRREHVREDGRWCRSCGPFAGWPCPTLVVVESVEPWATLARECGASAMGLTRTPAPGGCDYCSVEPGDHHRYEACPGAERQRAREAEAR